MRKKLKYVSKFLILINFFSLIFGLDNRRYQLDKEKRVLTVDLDVVEGRTVSIPCPLVTPLEDVYMILWFKDSSGIPFYSVDVRDKTLTPKPPTHWSAPEVFGPRAKFNIESNPAALDIREIKRHDQGIYRCRIDFRASQTQSFRYNLSVIILPDQPIILDRWGRQLNGTTIGPKQEGENLTITCRVVGGRPQPEVRWLINGHLIDDENEHNSGDVIENRLSWRPIKRSDLNSVFTCQTRNTKLIEPKETSYVLEMYLKPLTVEIKNPPEIVVAEKRYQIKCESMGSRPSAIITWYKGNRPLRRTKDDVLNDTRISELTFVPTVDDDNKSITCRAENSNVNGLFLETSWHLNVVYPPIVELRLGSTLLADDIKEGDDVYFECHVTSNPQWRKLLWLHNDAHLAHNTTARVIRSNQSLVLQKISRFSAGNYACSAINNQGETVSNQLPLRVKYTPICTTNKIILIGALKEETVDIKCEISSDPLPRTFRWKFNNSGETLNVDVERFSNNGTTSVLRYTPVTDQDYGTLSCWGINEVGIQEQPCVFQIVLAGLPSSVNNCTLYNQTQQSVGIQCIPGYDGGLPQIFVLELFSIKTGTVRFNFTNPDEPNFIIESLDVLNAMMTMENNSLKVLIYAINQKGRSQITVISNIIIGRILKHKAESIKFELTPIIIGSVLTILLSLACVVLRICYKKINLNKNSNSSSKRKAPDQQLNVKMNQNSSKTDLLYSNGGKDDTLKKPRWQPAIGTNNSSNCDNEIKSAIMPDTSSALEDERDPDVIPSHYATEHYMHTNQLTPEKYIITTTNHSDNKFSIKNSPFSTHLLETHNQLSHHLAHHNSQSQLFQHAGGGSTNLGPSNITIGPLVGGSDLDINISAIKDRLMTTRVPESCV